MTSERGWRLTVDHRLDLGYLHDLFHIGRSEVAQPKGTALQGPIPDQSLEMSPELGDRQPGFGGDERIVDQEEVGNEGEFVEGPLDGCPDAFQVEGCL